MKRSQNRILAGVCGGIAEYYRVDPLWIRLAFALLAVCSLGIAAVLLYAFVWLIMDT